MLDGFFCCGRNSIKFIFDMRAQVGRAGWLADRSEGSPDAGAMLVATVFEAARDAVGRDRG